MIDFLIGVGVVWGSQVVWMIRQRVARPKPPKPPVPVEAICGCDHHYSMHDPTTGACHAETQVVIEEGQPILDEYRERVVARKGAKYEWRQCGCRRYAGPEPLPSYYAPEISA